MRDSVSLFDLADGINKIRFSFYGLPDRYVLTFNERLSLNFTLTGSVQVYISNDGVNWTLVRTIQDSVFKVVGDVAYAYVTQDDGNPGPQLVIEIGSSMYILSFRRAGRIDFGYWENGQWNNVKSWTQYSVSLGERMKRVYFFHEDTNLGIRMTTSDDEQIAFHIDTVRNRLALYKDDTWYVFTPDLQSLATRLADFPEN